MRVLNTSTTLIYCLPHRYVNAQVESVSTRQALTRTYSMRPNCDLRELLGGTDRWGGRRGARTGKLSYV